MSLRRTKTPPPEAERRFLLSVLMGLLCVLCLIHSTFSP